MARSAISPRSVAVVGASRTPGKTGRVVLDNLVGMGFTGQVWAVNPGGYDLPGATTVPRVAALPSGVDHAALCLPAKLVPQAIAECGRVGIPYATIFSSGFEESGTPGGRSLQRALDEAAMEFGVRYIGPNAAGWLNTDMNTCCTISRTVTRSEPSRTRPVGVVTTSGGVGFVNLMWRSLKAGLNVKYVVTCGNEADLRSTDFASAMLEDPEIAAVMLVTEHIADGSTLRALGDQSLSAGTPVIIVPVGKTKSGHQTVESHTGALASDARMLTGVLHQFGFVVAEDADSLPCLSVPHITGCIPQNRQVGAVCISGGNLVLFADGMEPYGFGFPLLAVDTKAQLTRLLPPFGAVRNPLDLTAAGSTEDGHYLREALDLLSEDRNTGLVVPLLTHAPTGMIEVVRDHVIRKRKPLAALWTGGAIDSDLEPVSLVREGVACFSNVRDLSRSMDAAARFHELRQHHTHVQAPSERDVQVRTRAMIAQGEDGPRLWTELLTLYGIPTARELLVGSEEAALRAAASMGYPVAAKVASKAIAHKGLVDGLRLNLQGPDELSAAYRDLEAVLCAHGGITRGDNSDAGILVQEMVPPGFEFALGIKHDRNLGPVVLLGLGGALLEVVADVTFLSPPYTGEEVRKAISRLRCGEALVKRGTAGLLDLEALCMSAVGLGDLASDLREQVLEFDVNPVIVGESGAGVKAVDAWAHISECVLM